MILPFEEIYVLTLCEDKTRLQNFFAEIKKIGIENHIKVWYACKHPYTKTICNYLHDNGNFVWNGLGNGSAFNCTREHYNIIKQAFCRGIKSILVFEDDFCFKDDIDNIKEFLCKELPINWNSIRYGYIQTPLDKYFNDNLTTPDNYEYILNTYKLWGTQCYALNQNGMINYIKYMNNNYGVADLPLFNIGVTISKNNYIVLKNLCDIEKSEKIFNSTIQNEEEINNSWKQETSKEFK